MVRIIGLVLVFLAFSLTVESSAQMGGKGKKGGGGGDKKGPDVLKGKKGGSEGSVTKGEEGTVSGSIAAIGPNHIVVQQGGGGGKGDAKGGKGGDGGDKGGMGEGKGSKGGDAKGGKGGDAKGGKGGDGGGKADMGKGKAGGHVVLFLSPTTTMVDEAGNAAMGRNLKVGSPVQVRYQAVRSSSGQSAQFALEIKILTAAK